MKYFVIYLVQLGRQMGFTKLQSRTFLRNLVKMGITATYMNDMGRQRITKYVSKKFEKSSRMSKDFNKEIHKIKELTKNITSENEENQRNKANLQQKNGEIHEKKEHYQSLNFDDQNSTNVDVTLVVDNDTQRNCVRNSAELKNKFCVVNSIFRRYKLLRFRSKYKCTSTKSLNMSIEVENPSVSMEQIANNAEVTSLYNSIKTNLITQKPVRSGVSEVFGFMELVKNVDKKNVSNITYRFVTDKHF